MQSRNEDFESVLNKYGKFTYTNKGMSMFPMLRPEKDVFTIVKKAEERCKVNDVVLFKRNGKFILHRIVEVFDDHYSTLGDNCVNYEKNIKDEDILGILVSFQKNGHTINTDDIKYRIYVYFLRFFEKPRILMKRKLAALKRTVKQLLDFLR